MTILSFIPSLVFFSFQNSKSIFGNIWWLLLGSIALIITLSCITFFYKRKLLTQKGNLVYYIYAVYFLLWLTIYFTMAAYSYKICFSLSLMNLFALIVIIIGDKIEAMQTKYWIKLTFIYTCLLAYMIGYIIISNQQYVELFMMMVVLIYILGYLTIQVQFLVYNLLRTYFLKDAVELEEDKKAELIKNKNDEEDEEEIDFIIDLNPDSIQKVKTIFLLIIIFPIDMMVFTFK
jgi:hypothetical protein